MKLSHVALLALGMATINAQAALALDACLLGTWDADIPELVRQMEEGQPSVPIQIDVTSFGGSITMSISDDQRFKTLVEDIVIEQNTSGIGVVMQMNGDNIGSIDADDGVISLAVETFDVTTVVETGGQRIVVPARPAGAEPETFVGTYFCSETELAFTITMANLDPNAPAPMLPHRWTRQP